MMYRQQRQELTDQLSMKGIHDIYVLKAIGEVKRHLFVPNVMKHLSYNDVALPIGYGQTISQPYTLAFMTQELKLKQGQKVLELGTGSGYQAAILFQMGMEVYSIERNYDILLATQKLFDKLGIRIKTKCADGTLGWNEHAPFDGIIVTAGSPSVPVSLKNQLAVGGRIVIPVGNRDSQKLKIIKKNDEDDFEEEDIPEFKFVPLIGKEGWNDQN